MSDAMQADWDNAFLGLVPCQPTILSYMEDVYNFINLALLDRDIRAKKSQIIVFWEAYSQSRDGSWLSASDDVILEELETFLVDPAKWFRSHPHSNR